MSAGRTVNSRSKDWGTPQKYIDTIKDFFGGTIGLDPCSNQYSIVGAEINIILPNNGLLVEWDEKTVFVNPPYGADRERGATIKDWFSKAYYSHILYKNEIMMLVPVATNTSHWKHYVFGKADSICFLKDSRVKFLENGKEGGERRTYGLCNDLLWRT